MSEWTDEELKRQAARNPDFMKLNPELNPDKVDFGWKKDVKPSKYKAQRTRGYASKKEAEFADQLALRKEAGEVWFWLEQVPFKLPGGSTHRVDFMVFYAYPKSQWRSWALIEIKGRDLPLGKLKRKQVEEIYKVKIRVV